MIVCARVQTFADVGGGIVGKMWDSDKCLLVGKLKTESEC